MKFIPFFSTEFWHGVIRTHYPRMRLALQNAGADHLYAKTRRAVDTANTKFKN